MESLLREILEMRLNWFLGVFVEGHWHSKMLEVAILAFFLRPPPKAIVSFARDVFRGELG